MGNRLTYIDIAKGICIILVVIGHFQPANTPAWYMQLIDIIYTFHMPLFMYVSGFVYMKFRKPVKYTPFIWKKFKRLMIPYFLISILIISLKLLAERGMYVENPVTLSSVYETLYLPSAGFFLWFVYVLFLIFLIIPFFDTAKKINILLFIALILVLIPVKTTGLFCLEQLKNHLFYFVLGCFICQYQAVRDKISRIPAWAILFAFSIIYLPTTSISPLGDSLLAGKVFSLGLGVLGIAFVINLSRFIDSKMAAARKIFLHLAVYSFTIYLFHTTFQGLAKSVLLKFHLTEYLGDSAAFISSILIVNTIGIIGPIILYLLDAKREKIMKKSS
ncbi:acyltransferase family protein [Parabacteroides sp. PF5-6]|uniref:acyltransferase family protein n=1 Tax=Parabacteroides sp. PF5-6 TaxID=1742403 RepID=UPI0024064215|nr:acyltransferase family protein [Parabacteroides sp. PF5-6]MDF9830656.1 fucose 4-O-acetylase-like acetyltransferase [Parabacteroides sp. PF5-6]